MKKKPNRILHFAIIVAGIFLATAAASYIIPRLTAAAGTSLLTSSLIAGAAVAALTVPVLLWLIFRKPSPRDYSAYALEEVDLDESELIEAVGNWVYAKYRKRAEDEMRFLEDDDGNVSCRVTVRKD